MPSHKFHDEVTRQDGADDGLHVAAVAADSQTAALSDNANANIAQGGYAEDLVAADLDNRTQSIEYHDGADGGSDDEDGSEDAWSLTGR